MPGLFVVPLRIFTFLVVLSLVAACDNQPEQDQKKEILAYIGITMAKPMAEIARAIEKKHGVSVIITQGGSEDLYQSLKAAQKGDLYMPGSASYREKHLSEGLLGEFVEVGYNQASFLVAKGNPKGVTGDIEQVLRDDLDLVICNPDSGSIGRETKRILTQAGIYKDAFEGAEFLTTDSRNLNNAMRNGDADLIINWRATAFFDNNRPIIDVIDLPPDLATPKKLQLSLLTFSAHPDIARKMMAFTASPQGQAIFRKYGFIDAEGKSER